MQINSFPMKEQIMEKVFRERTREELEINLFKTLIFPSNIQIVPKYVSFGG